MKLSQSPQTLFTTDPGPDASRIAARLAVPAREGYFDELRGHGGTSLAPHWRSFFDLLGPDCISEMDRHAEAVVRQMDENGVTYNVYADPDGRVRPWSLDLLPLIITPDEWAGIEAGISQRAELLNAILADVYGQQTLLAEALLPPALVLGHPGYLRPLKGHVPAGGVHLHIAAFDLARAENGDWWVVSQRTQAPSGLGYMLENRLTISRMFPQAFQGMRVEHLARGYRTLMDSLYRLAPVEKNADGSRQPPRIVLFTPGPYNETYFEHAYLARYLGVTLVEGSDLTVRNERLYLKTLYGLERVHVVLRRLDDDFCDPLELRPDSTLGVTGLLQAVRAGTVLMANALGSSFLETPGLNGFLPAISERLLGKPLAMPSLPSWWCGETAAREAILPQLANLVIKPTYPGSMRHAAGFSEPVIGEHATREQLDVWRARIHAAPDAHTVQAYIPLSQAPTWSSGRIVPRAAMVRVFALANVDAEGQTSWMVMPGGLTRIATRNRQVVSMQRGGGSQDTWVMSAGAPDTFSLLPAQISPEDLAHKRRPVSSRAAENLFWMGRYCERADNSVRLARITLMWLTGDADTSQDFMILLAQVCKRGGLTVDDVPSPAQARRIFERTLVAGLSSPTEGGAVGSSLTALEGAAGQIRDRLSAEHWRLIRGAAADFEHRLAHLHEDGNYSSALALRALEGLATQIAAMTGAQADRMTRDAGWSLLTVGRQIERLGTMAAVLQEAFEGPLRETDLVFKLLLDTFDSTITYRAHYQARYELAPLIDLLVLDPANPRSLGCCVTTLIAEVTRLPRKAGTSDLAGLLPDPALWDLSALIELDDQGMAPAFQELVATLIDVTRVLSDEISERYFSHASEREHSVLR
jgi:uncharacterized circularly permuted ATP-grasp superfamily protein/uncharacterized alpha-E superfamily protein